MTRLKPEQVQKIPKKLQNYDQELMEKTGCSLLGIAKHALHIKKDITSILSKATAAIIPITTGKGIISGFADAVRAILTHIAIDAYITKKTDVAGFADAIFGQANLIFASDDAIFIAANLHTRYISDNAICTGKAYVAALDLIMKGLRGKTVLVLGFGPVGHAATIESLNRGAKVALYDIDKVKMGYAKREFKDRIHIVHSIKEGLEYAKLIVDATPVPDIISDDMISEDIFVAAPGIPLGLTNKALKKISQTHLIHDTLELGVATMALDAIFNSDS
ncbi:MAG: 3-methylornithyl-N6-L-lysine dehydrogenase PylD [Promethearchaeota archaeon]